MNATPTESVEDRKRLLVQDDHMNGMERIEMVVEALARPSPSVIRVAGRIAPSDPEAWRRPNLAIRLEVETPADQRPVSRVYTVRSFDAPRRVIEIDFVVHPDDSPAMRWVKSARPGTAIRLVGPRPHFLPNYAPGKRVALFADATAIPAVYAILHAWPAGIAGSLYIETDDPAAFAELPSVAGVEAHLLLRPAGEAPGTVQRLLAAAKSLATAEAWTVWAAGERSEARALRTHFVEDRGLAKEDARIIGYWRQGVSSSDIDRIRLKHYEALRSAGDGLRQFDDFDVPV